MTPDWSPSGSHRGLRWFSRRRANRPVHRRQVVAHDARSAIPSLHRGLYGPPLPEGLARCQPEPEAVLPVPVEGARMSELEEQNADRGTLPRSLNGPILTRMRRAKQPRR